jgi:RNA-directed DNA polymerase
MNRPRRLANQPWEEPVSEAKPYNIPKQLVWKAYRQVKANRGAAGVDGQSLAAFEKNLEDNLYKIWNRMASGCYFPPPVRLVEIPKGNGGTRALGIPTVADRIAQMVVKMVLEPLVEGKFHRDSYGYRPHRSALRAVGEARQRCFEFDWVIDLDIKAFFDSLDHHLVERAVAAQTDNPWVRLYIGRWLRAPPGTAGRDHPAAEQRHAARRSHKSVAGQSVPALCV